MSETVEGSQTIPGEDLLLWVVRNLSNCEATIASMNTPWESHVTAGWFFVYALRCGLCRLILDDQKPPLVLHAGDTIILPQCRGHLLQDEYCNDEARLQQVTWFEGSTEHRNEQEQGQLHGRHSSLMVCRFRKPTRQSNLLFGSLPPYILLPRNLDESNFSSLPVVSLLVEEISRRRSLNGMVIEQLAKALILHVIRERVSTPTVLDTPTNELSADPLIARALGLMHSRLEISWTVATLAAAVGVSRSTFAARFAQLGETPLNYLRRERMHRAVELLADEGLGIKEIAALVGYDSESAFSSAFKQWRGIAPGAFRRAMRSKS